MEKLPPHIKISQHENVVHWCRRSLYELVEEFSQGIFYLFIILVAVVDMWQYVDTAFYGFLFCVFPLWYMTKHYLDWVAEIHVITEYTTESNGAYYKYTGYFTQRMYEIQISRSSPDISQEMEYRMRLWRWITGEDIERITMSTPSKTHINAQRMSRKLREAIQFVKGNPAPKDTIDTPESVMYSQEVRHAWRDGLIPDYEARDLFVRLINGNN